MDEYKNVMYVSDPERFSTDPGDLTKAKLVKQRLNCKPFDYFLDKIAPEMYTRYYYQLHYPGYYALGAIESVALPNSCIDFMDHYDMPAQLNECRRQSPTRPVFTQNFKLTWHKKIRLFERDDCFQNNCYLNFCHYDGDHKFQDWKYDIDSKQIISSWNDKGCLTAGNDNKTLSVIPCDSKNLLQKWSWTSTNETALRNFEKIRYENKQFYGFDEL
jgi:polypeptide N-acetylgalactosaminyltransferase